jgi:hypothetical protein
MRATSNLATIDDKITKKPQITKKPHLHRRPNEREQKIQENKDKKTP